MRTSAPSQITVWILAALAAGPNHAYGIIQQVASDYAGIDYTSDRSIYAALERLEREKLIAKVEDHKHPFTCFSLTPFGRRIIRREGAKADRLSKLIRARL